MAAPSESLLMGVHAEEFRLQVGLTESEAACHRALRSLDWEEQASDRLEVPLHVSDGGSLVFAAILIVLELVPITRRFMRRSLTQSARAPEGPVRADAEIYGVWRALVVVRIALAERGTVGTDVTISGSAVRPVTDGTTRSAIRELRRSIEIQSGSLTPYQPPTA
jgi:hypothetical protein